MKRVLRSLRNGFTLPEVLVTVAIISVLAAAVVPTVMNQVSKGDLPSLQADLNSVRTAISNFTTDVRHYPHLMEELNGTTLSSSAADLSGGTYSTGTANFHGPYLSSKSTLSSSSLFKPAAYTMYIGDTLSDVAGHIAIKMYSTNSGTPSALTATDAATLKSLIDGSTLASTMPGSYTVASNGVTPCTNNGLSGLVRIYGTATVSGATGTNTGGSCGSFAVDSVKILLVPIGG